MQPTRVEGEGTEAEQLRERIWTYAQRGVVMAVVFFAGLFVGYQLWGQATQLQQQVEELTSGRVWSGRYRAQQGHAGRARQKELERQLGELKTKLAASAGASAPKAEPAGGGGTQGVKVE
jgi:cytochrome c-type biogenesis protein CcmH/NrfG